MFRPEDFATRSGPNPWNILAHNSVYFGKSSSITYQQKVPGPPFVAEHILRNTLLRSESGACFDPKTSPPAEGPPPISETGRWLLTEEHIVRDNHYVLCNVCLKQRGLPVSSN